MNIFDEHPRLINYMLQAHTIASQSRVTRKKMGAIILGQATRSRWDLLSQGCNGVASGADHIFEHEGITLPSVIHAEANAISFVDWKTVGKRYQRIVLLVTSSPCSSCSDLILGTPITDVGYTDAYRCHSSIARLADAIDLHSFGDKHREEACTQLAVASANMLLSPVAWRVIQEARNGRISWTAPLEIFSRAHLQEVIYSIIAAGSGWAESPTRITVANVVATDEHLTPTLSKYETLLLAVVNGSTGIYLKITHETSKSFYTLETGPIR